MSNFTLSALMSNYNHGKYIGDALEAILSQSYKPIEVIVIDDASTDNSVEIIKGFTKRNKIIRLITNEKNMGIMYNYNKILKISQGDYVYIASADDKILPGFFEKSVKLLEKYPQAGLCCSDSAGIDGNTGVILDKTIHILNNSSYLSPHIVVELLRKTPFYIEGHAAIVNKKVFLETGGLKPDLKLYCDWFVWLSIAFRHGICYIPETLTIFRAFSNSYFASELRNKSSRYEVIKRILFMLKTAEYKDVLPLFRRSCVLNEIYLEGIFYIILRNPKLWDFLSIATIRKSLSYNALNRLSPFTFPLVKRVYRNIRNRKMKSNSYKIIKKAKNIS